MLVDTCAALLAFVLSVMTYTDDGGGCPEIRPATQERMEEIICPDSRECRPVGIYGWKDNTIYYWDQFDESNPLLHSVIVHELVHHLQRANRGVPKTCRELLLFEAEAYAVQKHWLVVNNLAYYAQAFGGVQECEDARNDH